MPKALDLFYDQLRATPEVRRFFGDESHIARAKGAQSRHWDAISSAKFDGVFANNVRTVGLTHARIGLEPQWYIGGYAIIFEHLLKSIVAETWPKGMMSRGGARKGEQLAALVSICTQPSDNNWRISLGGQALYFDVTRCKRASESEHRNARLQGLVPSALRGRGRSSRSPSHVVTTFRISRFTSTGFVRKSLIPSRTQ